MAKKDEKLNLRLDEETLWMFRELQHWSGLSTSELIRALIIDAFKRLDYFLKMYGKVLDNHK